MKHDITPKGKIEHTDHPGRSDYLFRVSLKAVILNDQGHVLVVKESGRDWWDIPGGGIDHGESIQTALARELHEEVGYLGAFTYRTILAEDPVLLRDTHVYQMRITFLVQTDSFKFSTGEDGDEVAFIDHHSYADSNIATERKIFEYCELAL